MIGGSSSGARPQAGIYDASGAFVRTVRRIVRVVGPASYATGGFQVDCSAYFSSIVKASFLRGFTTATGATLPNQGGMPNETGADLYSAAKFKCLLFGSPSHTHTYDKANTPTGAPSGAPTGLGSDNAHTHALTFTSTASGAASTLPFQEQAGGALNTRTYEFEVEGVPL